MSTNQLVLGVLIHGHCVKMSDLGSNLREGRLVSQVQELAVHHVGVDMEEEVHVTLMWTQSRQLQSQPGRDMTCKTYSEKSISHSQAGSSQSSIGSPNTVILWRTCVQTCEPMGTFHVQGSKLSVHEGVMCKSSCL